MKYNYAFLAGYLEAEMKTLADDNNFAALKSRENRREYIQKIIDNARTKASEHEKKYSSSFSV